MKLSAVIFDLDGVIVSTDKYHYLAWKTLADSIGVEFSEEINNRLRGVSRMESLEIILEKYNGTPFSKEQKIAMAEKKNKIYREKLKELTAADVDSKVLSTLIKIKENGYKIAIGSSSKNTKFILERIGLDRFFDAVSDGNNITRSKPDPEVFLKAAEFLNVESNRCIIVEDAVSGVLAGKNANMATAAVGDASKKRCADFNLNNFSELLDVLKN